jgi:acyl-ACP thioesterase
LEKKLEMVKVFNNKYRINYNDSDYTGKLSIPKLGNYILDTAGLHAIELGISMQTLAEQGLTWVMSGLHFEFFDMPRVNQEVLVTTKISDCSKIACKRDFIVTGPNNEKIAEVSSEWLIINTLTRRPVFLNEVFPGVFDLIENNEKKIEKYKHLRFSIQNPEMSATRKITYSFIDINTHLYSMKYLEMTLDMFDLDFFKNNKIKKADVNFIKEVLYNQQIEINIQNPEPEIFQTEMTVEGKCVFRAEFETSRII